jgi:glucose/arabinose dehydrogenase
MTPSDIIALTLYTLCLGAVIGGAFLFVRWRDRRRWVGILFILEGIVIAVLLTLMSSRYWLTGGEGIIDLDLRPLAFNVAGVLLPLGFSLATVLVLGLIISRLIHGRLAWIALALPLALLPLVFVGGALQLVSITQANRLVPRDPQKGEITLLPGFSANIFSQEGFHVPTSIAFGPDGVLYVCDYNGDVWAVPDRDGDGVAETPQVYARGLFEPVGLVWRGDALYLASHGKVSTLRDTDGDGTVDEIRDIVTGLPSRIYPWHSNNDLTFGPDGRLYFGVGSTTDAGPITYPYETQILSVNPDGSDLRVFATGVRNPYDLAFNAAGDLFATDNGPNALVLTPGDEFNHIVEGGDYGFPDYFEQPPPNSNTRGPLVIFPPHSSADGVVFYHANQFPLEYQDNAFVPLWHRGEVYRIRLTKMPDGEYMANASVFAGGFLHPLDVTVGPDGSLYLTDYGTSAIYRITYRR